MEFKVIRVHPNFLKRIDDFIGKFDEKHGITLSYSQATKIIDDKIGKQGGLVA